MNNRKELYKHEIKELVRSFERQFQQYNSLTFKQRIDVWEEFQRLKNYISLYFKEEGMNL